MRSLSSVEANVKASAAGTLTQETLDALHRHAWDRNFYD
jgi:hypothetical protein